MQFADVSVACFLARASVCVPPTAGMRPGFPIIAIDVDLSLSSSAATTSQSTPSPRLTTWSALAFKVSDTGRAIASRLFASEEAATLAEQREHDRREEEDRIKHLQAFTRDLDAAVAIGDRYQLDALAKRDWCVCVAPLMLVT